MLAMVAEKFGPPSVLRLRDWPAPEIDRDEVLLGVEAAGVNPVDAGNRADGSWAGIVAPFIPGSDAAGTILAVGAGVRGFSVGDRVFAMVDFLGRQMGTYAELVAVRAEHVALIPDGLGTVEAATVPLAAGTAYEAVATRLAIEAGETIVILGAAGGVGAFAVQMVRDRGASVVAVASRRHWAFLRRLGATTCIDYHEGEVAQSILKRHPSRVDAVVDLVGSGSLADVVDAIKPFGRAATTVAIDGDLGPAIDRNLTIHGVLVRPDGARLRAIAGLLAAGRIRAPVAKAYPLLRAADAHVRIETGHGWGKLVLKVAKSRPTAAQ